MKGIILAGGKGTRLYPVTKVISKQLLPIYDKPMIYYPLSILMLARIKDILIISTPHDLPLYKELLGDGHDIGIKLEYIVQKEPRGLADAFILGEQFIGDDSVCLILGDNIFYGQGLSDILKQAVGNKNEVTIFGYQVKNPKEFGVVEFDGDGNALSIEEKPQVPKSNYAVPGLYFCDNGVVKIAKRIKPSARGEIEITAIINEYLKMKKLKVIKLGRGFAWLDTGSPQGLLSASMFVESMQSRQGYYVSCIEEIAYKRGFIDIERLKALGNRLQNTEYGQYIASLVLEAERK
jgi:glucose-1-phosphate thymidylyltransferase